MNKQALILEQIDSKIVILKKVEGALTPPSSGWVYAIRKALKMSLKQLGKRMNITAQSVKEIEEREKNGSLTVKSLKQFGKSLSLKFVYGFIPEDESLEKMIENRAIILANEIVNRTSINMKLEDQENNPTRIQRAIDEKVTELKREMPKYLWD